MCVLKDEWLNGRPFVQQSSDEELDAFLEKNLVEFRAFIDELNAQVHWVPAKKQDGPIVPATS